VDRRLSPGDVGSATEDELAAERAAAKTTIVAASTRKRPSRIPFPEHLPRERIIEPAPTACLCCGRERLRKLNEDITETLEVIVLGTLPPEVFDVWEAIKSLVAEEALDRIAAGT
jgi:hypothetical protein